MILIIHIRNVKHLNVNKIVLHKILLSYMRVWEIVLVRIVFYVSMNLKAESAKSCEYNSNFYDYEVFTVNTNSSLWVQVEKCWNDIT